MKKDEENKDLLTEIEIEIPEEKAKTLPPKPLISRSGPAFPVAHQFRGAQGNNINNRQRPGRAANRGR